MISAIPDAQEFQELSFVLPQGIGPIGIYHSHPFSSEIFHSHTDNFTLISLSNQFPQCISIITNGQQINYYQMDKKGKIKEIEVKKVEVKTPKFLLFSMKEDLVINLHKESITGSINREKLKIKIINKIREFFEESWEDMELFHKHRLIKKNEYIKPYLVDSICEDPVIMKIPDHYKIHKKNELFIETINKNSEINTLSFNLMIKTTIPIYIIEVKKKYNEISQLIKTEFISNNILQKVYNSIIDIENTQIFLPEDFFLNYFGFYIKLISFADNFIAHNGLYKSNFKFLKKLLSNFEIFTNKKMDNKFKKNLFMFLKDLKNSKNLFNGEEEFIKKFSTIEKELNFKNI
ncbi:MAG: hypothetical protein ACFFCE_06230 [Promethearchaeota archaeon]